MSDEDTDSRECLRQHPAMEMSMWQSWVLTVCGWRKISAPTGREWDALMARWEHGKMPVTSVDELQALRRDAAPQPGTPS